MQDAVMSTARNADKIFLIFTKIPPCVKKYLYMVVIYLKIPFVKGIAKNYIHNFHAVKIIVCDCVDFFHYM